MGMRVKCSDTKPAANWLCVLSRGRPTDPVNGVTFLTSRPSQLLTK